MGLRSYVVAHLTGVRPLAVRTVQIRDHRTDRTYQLWRYDQPLPPQARRAWQRARLRTGLLMHHTLTRRVCTYLAVRGRM